MTAANALLASGSASRRAMALHRQVVLPVAALLIAAAAAISGLMLINAATQDEIARVASIAAIREGIDERAAQLDRVVKDYAWWNEAVEAIQLRQDPDWPSLRLGYYLYGTHAYDWAFVIAPDDSTYFAAHEGEPVEDDISTALGNESWRELVQQGRLTPEDEPAAIHAFLPMAGGIGIASVAAITAEGSWAGARPQGPRYVLVVIRQLTGEWLGELATALNLKHLRFLGVTEQVPTGVDLIGPANLPIGQVAWDPHRPGTQYLRSLAPPLAVAVLLFAIFGWAAFRISRQTAAAIVESEARFRDVADASSDWIFEADRGGRLLWLSDRFVALTGIGSHHVLGRPLAELLRPIAEDITSPELEAAMREDRSFREVPRTYHDHEGRQRTLKVAGRPVRDQQGMTIGWRGTATDITVELEARRAAHFLSHHDPLTGCLNRRGLDEALTTMLGGMGRRDGQAALIMFDLDRLKEVNDLHGPAIGDELIKIVATRLERAARAGDIVARAGSDEFVLVRPGVDGPQGALRLARKLQARLGEQVHLNEVDVGTSLSAAVVMLPTDAAHAERAMQLAGIAMTRAKVEGRAGLRSFEAGMDANIQARNRLEHDLVRALAERQFEVFYQPKMSLRTQTFSGVEALIRWRHPQRGMIPPADFIPLAEESGVIVPIGRWVLEEACRNASRWNGVPVAVNLSPAQFTDDDLAATVSRALHGSGLPPQLLELEITEGVLLADDTRSNATMERLGELGVRIAMDDFGTGYSSMSYLTKFKFDKIKIDRSFVQALDRGGEAIILAIAGMTKKLGIQSCAEGIETEDQMMELRRIGIDEMQGFWYGRPMPLAELTARFDLDGREARIQLAS